MKQQSTLSTAMFVCRDCNRRARVHRNTVVGLECRACADRTSRRERATTSIDVETPHEQDRRVSYGFE